ncbi:MAG: membrane protein insertase YidC [Bifidobacteriaceae bacterium]|jgi:YidC/Oxa1 family membrane protein insertase|nr:membrane protein insertase YidC [Bifidobacteriaceae bacterium]
MDWLDPILKPIMWAVAWIMYLAHEGGVALGLSAGLAWILSIVVLVVIMRVIMIPLFVKQIRSSRGMQLLQPELQKIQKRYKGKTDPVSRRRMQEETMALYRKNGSNPMSGCWPVLAQSPLFFALFRVLYSLGQIANGTYPKGDSIGPITQDVAVKIQETKLFGAPLSATFLDQDTWAGAGAGPVRVVTVILIILMSVTTFTTQRQLTMKNMPASAQDNPMFRTQKMMMYAMPGIFAVSGVNFPIGVLIYWLTTNLWSMGQQFLVIRNMPAPGSEAERRMRERQARRRARKGLPEGEDAAGSAPGPDDAAGPGGAPPAGRVQPKRTTRAQRRSGPLQASNPSPSPAAPRREAEPGDPDPGQTPAAEAAEPAAPGAKAAGPGSGSGAKAAGAKTSAAGRGQTPKAGPAERQNPAAAKAPSPGPAAKPAAPAAGAGGRPGARPQPKKQPRKKRKK